MNAWHYLKQSKGAGTATQLIFVDTETIRERHPTRPNRYRHTLKLGYAESVRREGSQFGRVKGYEFTDCQAFWSWLESVADPRRKTFVFAHNLLFDLGVLEFWRETEELRITLTGSYNPAKNQKEPDPLVVLSSPPTILGAKLRTGASVVFLDTLNFVTKPLAKIAKSLNMTKPEIDFETADEREVMARCKADVKLIRAMIERIIAMLDYCNLSGLRFTTSSIAMASYKCFVPPKTICIHDDLSVKLLERTAFIASEIECFKIGKFSGMFHLIDCNSLYPFVMRDNFFPVKMTGNVILDGTRLAPDSLDLSRCIADVAIDSPHIPVNCRLAGLSMRCTGQLRTTLPGPDLIHLSRLGLIRNIYRLAAYEMQDIFAAYVNMMLHIRDVYTKCGKQFEADFAKNLANALFGKFSQKSYGQTYCPDIFPPEAFCNWAGYDGSTDTIEQYFSIGWRTFKKSERGEIESSAPAISAFVTAYARQYMSKVRHIAGTGNVYYQGVDGLIVNSEGYHALESAGFLHPSEPGKFKTQYTSDTIEIRGTCNYTIGERHVIGRIPRKVIRREGNIVVVKKFYSPRPDLGRTPSREVIEADETLTLSGQYRKGIVATDGTVTPFMLPRDLALIQAQLR